MLVKICAVLLCAVSLCSALYDEKVIRRNSTGLTNAVTWDSHSLFLQGQRVFILSAEIHPWRLPGNPNLWADIFQKVKANGFNTVSFYVNWAVHFPTPSANDGQGDFQSGTYRDIQRFIDEGKKAGLWMIARSLPGFSYLALLTSDIFRSGLDHTSVRVLSSIYTPFLINYWK